MILLSIFCSASFDNCQLTADRQSDGADERSRDVSDSACSLKYLENEEEDVELFLKDYRENNGVVDLMTRYLLKLADRSHLVWSVSLIKLILNISDVDFDCVVISLSDRKKRAFLNESVYRTWCAFV